MSTKDVVSRFLACQREMYASYDMLGRHYALFGDPIRRFAAAIWSALGDAERLRRRETLDVGLRLIRYELPGE